MWYYRFFFFVFFFFKQKTAYEMRISDWSSDVCSSDLWPARDGRLALPAREIRPPMGAGTGHPAGAPAHAAGVGPLTLHVVQANLLPAPERRAHAEVLD